jgi:hypothetical protein
VQMPPPVSLTPRTNGTTGLRAGCGLCMHQYIIGATRSGKSNYLMTLARSEEPFCFIDKHGTTARQIADAMLCMYWRPADLDFPIGLNPLQNVPPDERWRVTADIVSARTVSDAIEGGAQARREVEGSWQHRHLTRSASRSAASKARHPA